MTFLKKMHSLSIHALNACAVATLISLILNILTAACLYLHELGKHETQQH